MPRTITVGMPVYRGADRVAAALDCLLEQTFTDFDVIISVDGGDEETAEACRPYLDDDRFSMVVHDERLDWFGNLNWLLQQPMGEFFCYRQHDDTTTPDFFERLLREARTRPDAAIVYADCQWEGGRNDLETAPSIEGQVLSRMQQYIEQKQPVAVRGLMRREAVEQAGLVRSDEFRGLSEVFVWLAKVLRAGPFVRVPEPLYHRLDHSENYHKQWFDWSDERKRGSWSTLFTGLMEATIPVCRTDEERLFFQQVILDRICVVRPGQSYHYTPDSPHDSGRLMKECLARLESEGLGHLWQLPAHVVSEHEGRVQRLREVNQGLRARNRRLRAKKERLSRRLASARSRRETEPVPPPVPAPGWRAGWRRAR
jgi:glycosyltransferase involved in cell wall biosynthesis